MALVYSSMPLSPLSRYSFSEARSLFVKLESMPVIMGTTFTRPSSMPPRPDMSYASSLELEASLPSASSAPSAPKSKEVMSKPVLVICSGYSESVSSSTLLM